MKKILLNFPVVLLIVLSYGVLDAQQLAFPEAEGFGRFTKGGRGGDVYHVTTLKDYDPQSDLPIEGSLRHGIMSQNGPRTIVFDVSGTILLKDELKATQSYLTIAGQTAPGDGITLRDNVFMVAGQSDQVIEDVIIRFIRFRYGDVSQRSDDALTTNYVKNMIFDHVSISWSVDALHDLRGIADVTVQWSILSEALNKSFHYRGGEHAMLSSYRDLRGNVSVHHNLMASSRDRHPTLGSGKRTDTLSIIDFRNNVNFNWRGGTNLGEVRHNIVNNYYKPGASTDYSKVKPLNIKSSRSESARGYLAGNLFIGAPDIYNTDNYSAVNYDSWGGNYNATTRKQFEWNKPFVRDRDVPYTHTPEQAYEVVLEYAGASLARDRVDERVVNGVKDGTGRLVNSQADVGGWPVLKQKRPRKDSDRDGMPDSWERKNGLDPAKASDGNEYTLSRGYTNLEVYLNSLVAHLYPQKR